MSETPAPYGTSVDHIHNTVGAAISLMKQALAENDAGLACGAAAELVNAVGDAFMFDALSNGYLPSDPRSTQQEVRDMLRDMAPKTTTSNLWGIVGKMHEKTAAAAH